MNALVALHVLHLDAVQLAAVDTCGATYITVLAYFVWHQEPASPPATNPSELSPPSQG